MNHDDVYYGSGNEERLTYTNRNEAIEMLIDSEPSPVPKTLELVKYRRVKIPKPDNSKANDILETVLERIDENYGDPEEPYSEATDEMEAAALEFLEKIHKLYIPWICEKESSETIDCEAWVKENADHWLIEGLTFEQ